MLLTALTAIIYAANILYNILSIQEISSNISSIYNNRLISITSLLEADRDSYQSRLEIAEMINDAESIDAAKLDQRLASMKENLEQIGTRYNKFRNLFDESGSDTLNAFEIFDQNYVLVSDLTEEIGRLARQSDFASIKSLYESQYSISFENMRSAMDQLTNVSYKYTEKEYQASIATAENVNTSAAIFFVIAITILIISGLFFTRNIVNQLGCEPYEAAAIAKNLARGSLDINLQKDNPRGLYKDLLSMKSQLRDVLKEIQGVSVNLASSAAQFLSSSQEISHGASSQASNAEEISSSVEEITASVELNNSNARETLKISKEAVTGISSSNSAVSDSIGKMEFVADKIKIISEIARQTDILALNAAVEAARAGEHGKGFAIVASEVRKLAERSKEAALEIEQLTTESSTVARESGNKLSATVPDIEKTAKLVEEIALSSEEQNSSLQQVNSAIQQLNQIIQQYAAGSVELAESSESLNKQADLLKKSIAFFKI
jgi:methyl-accepting chemotaxis protein